MSLHVGLRLFGLDVLSLDVDTDDDVTDEEPEHVDHLGIETNVLPCVLPERDGGPVEVFAQGRRP